MNSVDVYLKTRDSLADRPHRQKRFVRIAEKLMKEKPQLFNDMFSPDKETRKQTHLDIAKKLAVMKGENPDKIRYFDDGLVNEVLDEAATVAKEEFYGDIKIAYYNLMHRFHAAGNLERANICLNLLIREEEKEKLDKER
jgi:hypothetical protein